MYLVIGRGRKRRVYAIPCGYILSKESNAAETKQFIENACVILGLL